MEGAAKPSERKHRGSYNISPTTAGLQTSLLLFIPRTVAGPEVLGDRVRSSTPTPSTAVALHWSISPFRPKLPVPRVFLTLAPASSLQSFLAPAQALAVHSSPCLRINECPRRLAPARPATARSSRLAPSQSPKQSASVRMLRRRSFSISKIDSILPRTRTRRTRTRHSLTPSSTRRPRSAHRAHKQGPLLLVPSRIRPCTSASTRLCCTMPSTAISVRSTLVTFTALPSSCTRSSATLQTRSAQ